ncbi:MAG: dCTP deaminase [Candidatus Hodarchaeaceae archaeon]|nr:dCTP deaminase [Candidatus Hodarchaeaceae archaeon]
MVVLSGDQIREYLKMGKIVIEPFDEKLVGPSQVDLCLGSKFRVFKESGVVDPFDQKSIERNTELVDTKGKPFVLQPKQLVLGVTRERVAVPNDLVASIEGRSSVARMGVFIHISSGHVNPGSGVKGAFPVTLEILNMNPSPVKLYPGMRICQLLFYTMDRAVRKGYDELQGKYAGKVEPSESMAFKDNRGTP